MRERNGTTWALAAALLAAAILSFALVTPWAASAETHAASLTALEEKQSTVLELAAASTAASAAITLLPGDAATPIAEKLADISGYFLLALCAIYLEKYLLTVTAYAAFRLLVPAACLLLAAVPSPLPAAAGVVLLRGIQSLLLPLSQSIQNERAAPMGRAAQLSCNAMLLDLGGLCLYPAFGALADQGVAHAMLLGTLCCGIGAVLFGWGMNRPGRPPVSR